MVTVFQDHIKIIKTHKINNIYIMEIPILGLIIPKKNIFLYNRIAIFYIKRGSNITPKFKDFLPPFSKMGRIWLLIKIPLSRNGHSSRIKILFSRNFSEFHVYLKRGPYWPTIPLMKTRSPPAKLRQRITDHFLVAF
jgi:hypothetical protein